MQSTETRDILTEVASRFGRALTQEETESLARFFDLLLLWNRRINLTGARSPSALASEHFPDSLALSALVPRDQNVLDVGSGGGLPAIPFALLRPDARLALLEPRSRRAAFLRTAVRDLALPATIDPRRLEEVTEPFQVLSARAVLPPDDWLKSATPHLRPGGRIIVYLAEDAAWHPPTPYHLADRITYQAGNRARAALAITVPRGT